MIWQIDGKMIRYDYNFFTGFLRMVTENPEGIAILSYGGRATTYEELLDLPL